MESVIKQTHDEFWQDPRAPLYVDLDGTLLFTDTLWESILLLLKQKLWLIVLLPFWLARGKAFFKHKVADSINLELCTFPINTALLNFLQTQKRQGRKIILATAANEKIARHLAHLIGVFDEVLSSTATHNLSAHHKLAAIKAHNTEASFCYAGNSAADLIIWQEAEGIIHVGNKITLPDTLIHKPLIHIVRSYPKLKVFIKTLRIHQWIKNILIFIPLVASHNFFNRGLISESIIAFCAFCFCASSVYLINDLLDLHADRNHPNNQFRPVASGIISIPTALSLLGGTVIGTLLFAYSLPALFKLILLGYFIATLGYSLFLKKRVVIDVLMLAAFYMIRIFAGAAAINVALSHWLAAFSLFFFLHLAICKRYIELKILDATTDAHKAVLNTRGYQPNDIVILPIAGISSSYIATLIIALYVNSEMSSMLYHNPVYLWLFCPLLLYWNLRIWLLAMRGNINVDPLNFCVTDKAFYYSVLMTVIILIAAI